MVSTLFFNIIPLYFNARSYIFLLQNNNKKIKQKIKRTQKKKNKYKQTRIHNFAIVEIL